MLGIQKLRKILEKYLSQSTFLVILQIESLQFY